MSDQTTEESGGARANYPIPKGLGDLNYLQSLLKSIVSQDLTPDSAPTFLSLTLTNLTASLLVGTNASKALQSIDIGASLSLSGTTLNAIQNIRTTDSPTFAGLTLTTGAGASKVWTSNASGVGSWQTPTPAGVTSVFTRTGAVVAVSNDYTWAQIDKTTSSIADIATRSHTSLTDIGTLAHGTIDGYLDQAVKIASSPVFASIKLTTGAGANKILKSDADGDATWGALVEYANNTAAVAAGLTAGELYHMPVILDNYYVCVVQ